MTEEYQETKDVVVEEFGKYRIKDQVLGERVVSAAFSPKTIMEALARAQKQGGQVQSIADSVVARVKLDADSYCGTDDAEKDQMTSTFAASYSKGGKVVTAFFEMPAAQEAIDVLGRLKENNTFYAADFGGDFCIATRNEPLLNQLLQRAEFEGRVVQSIAAQNSNDAECVMIPIEEAGTHPYVRALTGNPEVTRAYVRHLMQETEMARSLGREEERTLALSSFQTDAIFRDIVAGKIGLYRNGQRLETKVVIPERPILLGTVNLAEAEHRCFDIDGEISPRRYTRIRYSTK